ncbi:cystinosin homolog [Diaphorina citri]|uniref:Cystinosin homolog n=1 Tax=Diaphorina citri TaxID=121845 RepID=A0A3Q0IR79_DIACI|nr:cystinosin homolog [Diaphorina citri]
MIALDFTGGMFSILQMVILAINFDDWDGFLIDRTKLGLGLFSVSFDILFMIQHYVLYSIKPSDIHVAVEKDFRLGLASDIIGWIYFSAWTISFYPQLYTNYKKKSIKPSDIHVAVEKDFRLGLASDIIGWIYFSAWTISFYPQLYTNYKKKSVIGLNFDFLGLNLIGFTLYRFTLYSLYNLGYYSSSLIQDQFFEKNGTNSNPVQLNDVFFSIHATIITLLTIFQCLIYERGTQKVSIGARCLMCAYFLYLSGVLGLVLFNKFQWIDFLNQCSDVKLTITLIKYIPQVSDQWGPFRQLIKVFGSIANVFNKTELKHIKEIPALVRENMGVARK